MNPLVTPQVTVLMPVFNGGKWLNESITSILQQSFTDYEFIIIDDGSTDNSESIIKSYSDRRIKLIQHKNNLGLINSLNQGLEVARGQYIARMDADDISLPFRLAKQVNFMNNNPHIGILGTFYSMFGEKNCSFCLLPIDSLTIKSTLFFNCCLGHPSVMMRSAFLKTSGLHYESCYPYAEDYGLWIKCSFQFPLANIPEVLLKYRITASSICRKHVEEQHKTIQLIHTENLQRLGIYDMIPKEISLHQSISQHLQCNTAEQLTSVEEWLLRILTANQQTKCYPEPHFSELLSRCWLNASKLLYVTTDWGKDICKNSPLYSSTFTRIVNKF